MPTKVDEAKARGHLSDGQRCNTNADDPCARASTELPPEASSPQALSQELVLRIAGLMTLLGL